MLITRYIRIVVLLVSLCPAWLSATAQGDLSKVYTEERPLVYEDSWDLWPYSFLNDKGQPDGFNIDLINMMMKELDIPYIIKLKPQQEAFQDLKAGKSDLTLGLAVGFHDEFGLYGRNAITLFTQSVVTPKSKPVEIKTFRDLNKPGLKVIVNDSSLCHHLMLDYGWTEHAIVSRDLREVIQQVSAKEEGQIVWNTLSLKWLIHRYHIDNVELTPVNMPHGEYKFMSNNQQLLDKLDELYSKLYTADKLTPLQNKWFYPEREKPSTPKWIWHLSGIALLLLIIGVVYFTSYRLQNGRIMRANNKLNRRLALILQTSQVRIWTYNVKTNTFAWRNENGQIAYTYTMDEFSQRYSEEDFQRLKNALDRLANQKKDQKGKEEEEITLELKAKDVEGGDHELHDFVIALSILSRDKHGKPDVIIGTKKDVTEQRRLERQDDERTLRYWSIFYTSVVGIILFDKDGYLCNINPKACEIYNCDSDEIIDEHVHLNDCFHTGLTDLRDTDGFFATQIINLSKIPFEERRVRSVKRKGRLYNDFRMMTVYDDDHELLGIFVFCRDISDSVTGIEQYAVEETRLKAVKKVLEEYDTDIDTVLHESDVRLVTYSPGSHTLTILRSINEVQHALTQTRCMTLVDDQSKKLAMRVLNEMDDRTDKKFKINIRTTLRIKGGKRLELQFCLMPMHDKDGQVTEYLGLLRDFSELREIEQQLAEKTAKVQEVENTKNKFVKNMVQEIRTPLNTVMDYVNQLSDTKPAPNEEELRKGILDNADYLIHLIDNILYLSRLEAKMVEINKQPCNLADRFESLCMAGWMKYKNPDTKYVVENPYEQLIVDIDADNLAHAIAQLTANAAQHTFSGTVRARYDYIGRVLIITVDDTGEGISKKDLARLKEKGSSGTNNTKGLGLAITKEIVSQMGGRVDISSEEGSGTTVYIVIPCHASSIKRKKIV